MNQEKRTIKISVRNLVEFVMRGGDIDNRRTSGGDKDAMQAGSRIHRKIQRRMGSDYHPEVSMRYVVEQEGYCLVIEGRADGIIETNTQVTIDEIKGIYKDLQTIDEPVPVHLAQAMCYGYFYCKDKKRDCITIQITYCNLETEEIRRFHQDKTWEELEIWFQGLVHEYFKWAEYLYRHEQRREVSLKALVFPYEYRQGQKELAVSVYRSIVRGKNLFIQAPTGIGKTLSTVFPALKAMGEGYGEKLFYLTAKTVTHSVAENCFRLLREQSTVFSTVTITAKEKLCPLEVTECNPDACPYAKGHFDRVNEAVFAIIHEETGIGRETLLKYAEKYRVCPYEFCLDVSNWVDGIICDYNYVFDPEARLKRYFSEGINGDYLFLIDEAHNLVSRAREMYSALLVKEDFLAVKRIIKNRWQILEKSLDRCNKRLLQWKRETQDYQLLDEIGDFTGALMTAFGELERLLEEEKEFPDRDFVLNFYFQVRHFLNMYECVDEHYRMYVQQGKDGQFWIRLFCINPSKCLSDCLDKGRSTVFSSATLLPILYYKKLLSGNTEDYAVYADSPFEEKNRQLLIGTDVSSRYTRRNPQEYQKIVTYIEALATSHKGNYLVFFPSYQYMEAVGRQLESTYSGGYEWSMQSSHMTEGERENFLESFEQEREISYIAMCVLGGIFSEGIDLREERLEGVIVVGTGLPMVCTEQEILKNYFDEIGENGYDFAYQYPGMNKVMQAAGRVIRTAKDRGIILLLDDRFLRPEVLNMFPREWASYGQVNRENAKEWMERFWNPKAYQ